MLWRGQRIERGTVLTRDFTLGAVARAEAADPEDFSAGVYASGFLSTPEPDVDSWVLPSGVWADSIEFWARKLKRPLPMFFNHDRDVLIGRHANLEIRDGGLWAERSEFDMADPVAALHAGKMLRGFLWGWSVGFRVLDEPKYSEADEALYFGKVLLLEASLVTLPANLLSQVSDSVAIEPGKIASLEADLAAARASIALLNREVVELRSSTRELVVEAARDLMESAKAGLADEVSREIAALRSRQVAGSAVAELRRGLREIRAGDPFSRLAADLDTISRIEDVPMDPGGDYPGHGGGGSPPPGPGEPDVSNPNEPAGGDSPAPAGDETDPGEDKRPVENGPRETPPDLLDGHRHRIEELLADGSGYTSMDPSEEFLAHAHRIDSWTVKAVQVAGKESDHPGSLYPPGELAAPSERERAIERLLGSLLGRTSDG